MAKPFKVALNPRNPEAASWYDPITGTNLFLSTPISKDLSGYSIEQLKAIQIGIKHGLLIVAEGGLPEGVELDQISQFAAPRPRYKQDVSREDEETQKKAAELDRDMTKALENWDKLTVENKKPAGKATGKGETQE